jgi:hypothetical protein
VNKENSMDRCAPRTAVGGCVAAGTRFARRVIAPVVLVLAVFAFGTPRAAADIGWCRTDPGVAVGGQVVNIFVSAPPEILTAATGPTAVVVSVPVGIEAEVLWTDPGFGYGETVTIVESSRLRASRGGLQIIVAVTVPASAKLPVLVEIVPESAGGVSASATGSTNGTVRTWTTL